MEPTTLSENLAGSPLKANAAAAAVADDVSDLTAADFVERQLLEAMVAREQERMAEMAALRKDLSAATALVAALSARLEAMERTQVEVVELWERNHVGTESGILRILRECWAGQQAAKAAVESGRREEDGEEGGEEEEEVQRQRHHRRKRREAKAAAAAAAAAAEAGTDIAALAAAATTTEVGAGADAAGEGKDRGGWRAKPPASPAKSAAAGKGGAAPSPGRQQRISTTEVKRKFNLGLFQFEKVREVERAQLAVDDGDGDDSFSDDSNDSDDDEPSSSSEDGGSSGGRASATSAKAAPRLMVGDTCRVPLVMDDES